MPLETTRTASNSASLWAIVSQYLEGFAKAWETHAKPPNLVDHLPERPPEARQLLLVELVKLDLDNRLQRGMARSIEAYMRDFPELAASGPPCDLLYEDFHLRRQAGEDVDPADYYHRFPNQAGELARLLGGTAGDRSTSVYVAKASIDVAPGDQLDDFDLLALLGEGQFAKVFLARQRTMQRLVALKVSAHRGAEAQTLAQLDHPHIVRVYDRRYLPDREALLVYMPYLAGGTLHNVLARVRAVPPEARSGKTLLEAVDSSLERRGEIPPASSSIRQQWAERSWPSTVCARGVKLAAALDYAHRHDVLHRDVKPANVLLTSEGEPLLADFNVGCCSKLDGAGPASFFGGSLGYMAVEHLEAFNPEHPREADSLDGRADLFSLAVTLWEVLTGERPFGPEQMRGPWPETLKALTAQRRAGPLPEVVAACPEGDVPGLREVLLRCLDPDPDRRPATAGEMARELELCLHPATRNLVRPAPGGWREFVRRHPLLTIYPVGLAPNAVASVFNIVYNRSEIIQQWIKVPDVFDRISLAVNGVFFPLGMLLFALIIRPVSHGLRKIRAGEILDAAERARRRQWALRLGSLTAGLCVSFWVVAGLTFPITLRIVAGPPPQGESVYLHFLLSLVICGLIAGAYPYFLITFLAVRVLYPSLLDPSAPTAADSRALHWVERELGRYRIVSVSIPFLAVALLAFRGLANPIAAYAVAVLSVAGLGGTLLAFALESRTRADLAALAAVPGAKPHNG